MEILQSMAKRPWVQLLFFLVVIWYLPNHSLAAAPGPHKTYIMLAQGHLAGSVYTVTGRWESGLPQFASNQHTVQSQGWHGESNHPARRTLAAAVITQPGPNCRFGAAVLDSGRTQKSSLGHSVAHHSSHIDGHYDADHD